MASGFKESDFAGRIIHSTQRRAPPSTTAPTSGEPLPKARKKTSTGTNSLTKAALALLQLHGFKVWRRNNAGVYDTKLQVYRAGSSTPGISDLIGYHQATGRFAAVEIKSGADTLSDKQEAFLNEVRRAGGFACVGRDIGQITREMKQFLSSLTH
jgi:hypothetical protein